MTRPPFRTSSSRYIRAIQSRQALLNLSRLPKLPKGAPPLISRRSTSGDLENNVTWSERRKAIDDDFAQAARREASAEKQVVQKSGKLSQNVMRFPRVQMPALDIRMIPKKMLVIKEQEMSPILSKNPRKERSDLSLIVIIPKATVHRFAVVRVRIKRRIVGALDLIVRRGASPFPETNPKQWESKVKDKKLDLEGPRVLLHDPTLANHQAWILPDWTYVISPKAEVFKMPLPDLVDQVRLGLEQANQKARTWQDRYMSPETGEFIPHFSRGSPEPIQKNRSRSRREEEEKSGVSRFRQRSRRPPGTL